MLITILALSLVGELAAAGQPDLLAAETWVGLIDAKHWDDSWSSAGALLKSQMPRSRWASTVEPVRAPLGAVRSRIVNSVKQSKTLPGTPDGDYEVIEFRTRFANKADAAETVVLSREGGEWKVDGYFIR